MPEVRPLGCIFVVQIPGAPAALVHIPGVHPWAIALGPGGPGAYPWYISLCAQNK